VHSLSGIKIGLNKINLKKEAVAIPSQNFIEYIFE